MALFWKNSSFQPFTIFAKMSHHKQLSGSPLWMPLFAADFEQAPIEFEWPFKYGIERLVFTSLRKIGCEEQKRVTKAL